MQQNGNFIHKLNDVGNRSCNLFLTSLFFYTTIVPAKPNCRCVFNTTFDTSVRLDETGSYADIPCNAEEASIKHPSTLLTNVVEITTATFKLSSILIENLLLCYLSYEYFTKFSSIKCSYNFITVVTKRFEVSCKVFESLLLAVLNGTFKGFNVYKSCRQLSTKLVNWLLRSVVHRPYQVLTCF